MKLKKLLEKIFKIGIFGSVIGGIAYFLQKSWKKEIEIGQRYKSYYSITNQWILNKNESKDIAKYFHERDIKSIAIYGMGTIGELFFQDIKQTDINIEYFVDRNADSIYYGLDNISVVGLDSITTQKEVDAIIITPIFDYEDIIKELRNKNINFRTISLEDIIYEI